MVDEVKKKLTCKDLVKERLRKRIIDLEKLWEAQQMGEEDDGELGNLNDYGLSLDYVEPDTFQCQPQGYIRYQISWGGPSDEFRFYEGGRIEYWFMDWFMDWFDGARRIPRGTDLALIGEIRDWLLDTVPSFDEAEKAAYEAGDFQYPNEDEDYLDELEDEDDD